jgi:hypothetical protein
MANRAAIWMTDVEQVGLCGTLHSSPVHLTLLLFIVSESVSFG